MEVTQSIQGQLEEIRLESVRANMPDMNIYSYFSQEETAKGVQVSYGGQNLAAKPAVPFSQTGEGISYYLLLDVSASISPEYFVQIKEAVLQFQQNMQSEDDLTLVTFGNEVNVLCQQVSKAENLQEQLDNLQNADENTLLFQAIQKTAELADKREEKLKRKLAVVVTDGEDFSQNTATQKEALSILEEKSVPLYGMAVQERNGGGENVYIDNMGEFCRSSGGILEVFGEQEAVAKLNRLQELFYQAYVICAEADSNQVSYQPQPLTLTFGNDQVRTVNVTAVYYQNDDQAPTAKVQKISNRELEVAFSEAVQQAQDADSYQIIIDEDRPLVVYDVNYDADSCKAVLTFEEEMANGRYEITFEHITDISMEKNLLKDICVIEITDGIELKSEENMLEKYQGLVIAGILGLSFLMAGLIALSVLHKRKGLVTVEGKAVLVSNLEKKHHVAVEKKEVQGHKLQFLLEGVTQGNEIITANVTGSLFVGRSSVCDIYMDDEKMSKQHFVIYENGIDFEIEDLQTTNGTSVNGTRIYQRTRLKSGDRIQAGQMRMTVRW